MDILNFLLTLCVATAGGLLLYKLKVPSGAMIGAMVAVVALNLLTTHAFIYDDTRLILQTLAGVMVGSRMDMTQVRQMKSLLKPIALLAVSMLIMNITFGFAIYALSPLDAATALFASAPGGATDMALIAADLGANTAQVALLQQFRLIVIISTMPPLYRFLINRISAKKQQAASDMPQEALAEVGKGAPHKGIKYLLPLFVCAAAGGLFFDYLHVAAGCMIGSMLFSSAFCVWRGQVYFPVVLRVALQVVAGAFIGIRLDRVSFLALGDLVVPMVVMCIGLYVFALLIAYVIHKVTKLDLATCMLASTPGGLQEMSLLSEDLGADTPKIAILQTARLMCVILMFPTMLTLMTRLFTLI